MSRYRSVVKESRLSIHPARSITGIMEAFPIRLFNSSTFDECMMTRYQSILPILALLLLTAPPARAVPDGDLNHDGSVNVADATAGLQSVVGLRPLSPEERERADVSPVLDG